MSRAIPAISIWVESESDRRVGLQSSPEKDHALNAVPADYYLCKQ